VVNRVAWYPKRQPLAHTAYVEGSHQRGSLLRSPANLGLKTETPMEALKCRSSDFDDMDRGIPHQRPVRKHPQIIIEAAGKRGASRGLTILV
jgi:hypothetical protein